jgi:methyl-accepting chemotaxis protein
MSKNAHPSLGSSLEAAETAKSVLTQDDSSSDISSGTIDSKMTLEEGLALPEPSISLSAGRMRGVMNKQGLKVETKQAIDSSSASPIEPSTSAQNQTGWPETDLNNHAQDEFTQAGHIESMRIPEWISRAHIAAQWSSVAWIVLCTLWLMMTLGTGLLSMSLPLLGGMVAGVLAPVALMWVTLGQITRAYDAQRYGQAMRAELHALIFPSEPRKQQISHDIALLCQQAAELETSSKTTLQAIQRSRLALQHEARDFLILSKKIETHIDRLSDNLVQRAGSLETLTTTIETRTTAIDEVAQKGAKAWDDTAKHILGKAEDIEKVLETGIEKLHDATKQAQEKAQEIDQKLQGTFDQLNTSAQSTVQQLETLSHDFEGHSAKLACATDHVKDETARLGQTIETQIKDLEGMASGIFETVSKSSEMIKGQRIALQNDASSILESAKTACGNLESTQGLLQMTAQKLDEHVDQAQSRVLAQRDILKETLYTIDHQIKEMEQAGETVSHRLAESLTVALSGADAVSSAVRRAADTMEISAHTVQIQAQEWIDKSLSSIDALQETGVAQMERAKQIYENLEQTRGLWVDDAQRAEEKAALIQKIYESQIAALEMSAAAAREKLKEAATLLDHPIDQIRSAVKEADLRHELIEQTLEKRTEDLTRSADKARDAADHIQTILRSQVQDISLMSGQLTGQIQSLNTAIMDQKDILKNQADGSVQVLKSVRDNLVDQQQSIENLTQNITRDLSSVHDRVEDRIGTLKLDSSQMLDRLQSLRDEIEQTSDKMAMHADKLRSDSIAVTSALEETVHQSEPLFHKAIDQITTTHEKLADLNTTFETTTLSNLERMQQMGIVFENNVSSLRTGVAEASQLLRTAGDELKSRVDDIEQAGVNASERMGTVSKTLNNQVTDIHILADQALLKIESVQKAVQAQFDDLNAAVGEAAIQLSGAEKNFIGTRTLLETSADRVTEKLQSLSKDTQKETETLGSAAQTIVHSTKNMITQLQAETRDILRSAHDALLEMKKTGDSISLRSREIDDHIKASLQTSQSYGRDLKSQATMIAEASNDTAEKVTRALQQLGTKMVEVEKTAQTAQEKIELMRSKIEGDASRFTQVARQAVEAADDASSAYVRQSSVLFKAAQDAATQIDKIKETQGKAQRDAFLSSAKFVIESLHSLSVDFVRMLEGSVPEKAWKAYQKGDIAQFTKRLLEQADQLPHEKIRTKYANDTEFRSYVQKFIRQFEDLFEQAHVNDHGELLTATFLSSDIGHLYALICTATGREPKAGRDLNMRGAA